MLLYDALSLLQYVLCKIVLFDAFVASDVM